MTQIIMCACDENINEQTSVRTKPKSTSNLHIDLSSNQ